LQVLHGKEITLIRLLLKRWEAQQGVLRILDLKNISKRFHVTDAMIVKDVRILL
jgi:hypothetical protein